MKSFCTLITLLCIFFINGKAIALSTVRFPEIPSKRKPLIFKIQTEFYHTQSNYESLGGYTDLKDTNYLQYFSFHPSLSYSPLPHYINLEVFANSFYISSKNQTQHLSNFQPSLIGSGVQAFHKYKRLYFGIEFRGGYPIFNNLYSIKQIPLVGEGSLFLESGLWLLYFMSKNFYIYENFSFRYRLSASEIIFNRLGMVINTQYTNMGFALDLFFPNQKETSQKMLERAKQRETFNAGSYRFSAIDPILLSYTGWLELKFHPLLTKLYFNFNSIGQNYAKGFTVGLITKFKWATKSALLKEKSKQIQLNFDRKNNFSEFDKSNRKNQFYKEEEDPYGPKNINQELKEELNNLKEEL